MESLRVFGNVLGSTMCPIEHCIIVTNTSLIKGSGKFSSILSIDEEMLVK